MAAWLGAGAGEVPAATRVILSHHDYEGTPDDETLTALAEEMFRAGADIAKIATTATRIEDAARMLALPGRAPGARCSCVLSWHCAAGVAPVTVCQTYRIAPALAKCNLHNAGARWPYVRI